MARKEAAKTEKKVIKVQRTGFGGYEGEGKGEEGNRRESENNENPYTVALRRRGHTQRVPARTSPSPFRSLSKHPARVQCSLTHIRYSSDNPTLATLDITLQPLLRNPLPQPSICHSGIVLRLRFTETYPMSLKPAYPNGSRVEGRRSLQ